MERICVLKTARNKGAGKGDDNSLANGIETATVALVEDVQYVIEVLDWMNADGDGSTGGEACLELTFELQ